MRLVRTLSKVFGVGLVAILAIQSASPRILSAGDLDRIAGAVFRNCTANGPSYCVDAGGVPTGACGTYTTCTQDKQTYWQWITGDKGNQLYCYTGIANPCTAVAGCEDRNTQFCAP